MSCVVDDLHSGSEGHRTPSASWEARDAVEYGILASPVRRLNTEEWSVDHSHLNSNQ